MFTLFSGPKTDFTKFVQGTMVWLVLCLSHVCYFTLRVVNIFPRLMFPNLFHLLISSHSVVIWTVPVLFKQYYL